MPRPSTNDPAIRIVTAASLFDGHDASINIMRRILQASGAAVIHLGHNRSVAQIVDAALQEDVNAIALSSYQGGHVEFLKPVISEGRMTEAGLIGGGDCRVRSAREWILGRGDSKTQRIII